MNALALCALLYAALTGQAEPADQPAAAPTGETVTTETSTTETTVTGETTVESVTETTTETEVVEEEDTGVSRLFDYIEPWREFRAGLEEAGVSFNVSMTQVFQFNTTETVSDANSPGAEYAGSLDVDLTLDFGKLLKSEALNGLSFYIYMDWGWANVDRQGLGPFVVQMAENTGAFNTPNWDGGSYGPFVGDYFINYIKTIDNFTFRYRFGKMDYFRTFDTNAYANSEAAQFLNQAFSNNPHLILSTDNGIGYGFGQEVYLDYSIDDGKFVPYVASGLYAANLNYGGWGIEDAISTRANDGSDDAVDWIWIGELGSKINFIDLGNGPMPGNYRLGFFYTSQEVNIVDYDRWQGRFGSKTEKGYNGFYVSLDQMLYKEKADSDTEGLGMFFRYSTANENHATPLTPNYAIKNFWSFGFQYTGLIPGRDEDVLAFGYAIDEFNDFNQPGFGRVTDEQVLEWYYRIQVFDWLQLTPDLQYILNPGGGGNNDAFVAGLRLQITF